jgi:hypothetical protein
VRPGGWEKAMKKVRNEKFQQKTLLYGTVVIYHFLHYKEIPSINGDFYGEICNKIFEKKFQLKTS